MCGTCELAARTQVDPGADAANQLPPNPEALAINREESNGLRLATGKVEHLPSEPSRLFMIPLEVFTQIMCNVQPGGLLALARTCKTLRTILLSKSTIGVWRVAEQTTSRLPTRPRGMSSPRYAALAFFNECSLCGKDQNIKLYAKLRVRLCESCIESELVDVWSIADYVGMPLEALLSVIFKTPAVQSKHKRETGMEFADGSPHCLRRDLRAYYATQKRFSRSGNWQELEIWEHEQHKLVHAHEEFAEMLVRFLAYPKLTPLQIAQLENTDDFFRDGPVMDYRAFNNGDDLSFANYANEDPISTKFTHEQCLHMHKVLKQTKQLFHPYRGVLVALGVETNIFNALMRMEEPDLNPFEDYPYPTAATALSWPLFSNVPELKASQILEVFHQDALETMRYIQNWREEGEKELVGWWKSDVELSDREFTDPIVKVKESTSATENLPADLRLLLRADTIFSLQQPGGHGYQGSMLYYPYYYKNPTGCPYPQAPSRMNSTRIYRHLEAEKVVKPLLRDLNMPDIAYIELAVIGALFACGRCHDCRPKKWHELVQHYRQEVHLWDKLQAPEPRFKTKWRINFYNIHDLGLSSASKPLALRLTKQEAVNANNSYLLNTSRRVACILCCNYQLRPTIQGLPQLQSHMKDIHGVTEPVKGLHYTSTGTVKDFGSWGKQWQENWDKHEPSQQATA
ncbi:hypothetical protein FRC08_006028 [Ceratobasidium sp. 394]|nr:hypothetical protein FRC08_006028 [Ceratobasidium sp. 394]KAG9094671.1 hypothetical protein FS749_012045 [Ceratobasidium sp. UAMH 11750]